MTMAHLSALEGNLDESRRMYEQARAALTGVMPEDSPWFSAIEQGLGDIARTQDKCKDAIPHFEAPIKLLEASGHGEDERATALTVAETRRPHGALQESAL